MQLTNAYTSRGRSLPLAWQLLYEREPHQNISHKKMPTMDEHEAFFDSRPYEAWYIVQVAASHVGMVYLSRQREIGVGIIKLHQGNGFGPHAVAMMMDKHPGKFLANINPANDASRKMFEGLGFTILQHTYALG